MWFLARIQPYRTVDNAIDGVVLTFADITERIQFLAMRQARDLAEAIVDSVQQPLLVLDSALGVLSANRAFLDTFHLQAADCAGQSLYALGQARWDQPAVRSLLQAALTDAGGKARGTLDSQPGEPWRLLHLGARRIAGARRADPIIVLSIAPEPAAAGA